MALAEKWYVGYQVRAVQHVQLKIWGFSQFVLYNTNLNKVRDVQHELDSKYLFFK
jgi:hypothetical protein